MMRRNRNGRPSLIGTAARTAVIAGTATAVAGSVAGAQQRSAQQRAMAQQHAETQQQVAPPAGGQTNDKLAQLQQLADLQKSGVLTEQEFADLKAKILAG